MHFVSWLPALVRLGGGIFFITFYYFCTFRLEAELFLFHFIIFLFLDLEAIYFLSLLEEVYLLTHLIIFLFLDLEAVYLVTPTWQSIQA